MLAVNWMTAEALGITESEKDALVKTLYMLESGELVYTSWNKPTTNKGFNMVGVMAVKPCGTVGCILGWARTFDKEAFRTQEWWTPFDQKMRPLFAPDGFGDGHFTVSQAAHALRTYFVTGTPDWA